MREADGDGKKLREVMDDETEQEGERRGQERLRNYNEMNRCNKWPGKGKKRQGGMKMEGEKQDRKKKK